MVRIEVSPEGRARVIGAMSLSVVNTLIEASVGGAMTLDLSQVYTADGAAVRRLAQLPPERCTLLATPPWLDVWIEHERRRGVANASRIHDESQTPGDAVGGEFRPSPVMETGHDVCPTGRTDDTEDMR